MGSIREICLDTSKVNILRTHTHNSRTHSDTDWNGMAARGMSRSHSNTDWNGFSNRTHLGHIPIQTGMDPATGHD